MRYPNNNWINTLIKDYTINNKADMNVSGGGKTAQYYIAGTYNIDRGILRTVGNSSFNSSSSADAGRTADSRLEQQGVRIEVRRGQ